MQRPSTEPALVWPARRVRAFGEAVLDLWEAYHETLPTLPAGRDHTPEQVRAAVTMPVPDEPLDDAELLGNLREIVLERSIQPAHGGFMAYICGAGTVPGGPASLLASTINQNLGLWPLSPAATEIESHLLRWFASRLGLPEQTSGAFVAGGATANHLALAVARDTLAGWDVRQDGIAAGPPLAVYASEDVHETIDRAADLLGLGSRAVRRIRADERMRVSPAALAAAIEADVEAGARPLCVVGTAGTTPCGAIDPLEELAIIAAEHGCWFHVDAAYGGPAAMVDDLRSRFAGIERADSITCDPHKWLNTPVSSSVVLFRDPAAHLAAFTLEPDYAREDPAWSDQGIMRYQWTPQFTRPFDALGVWVSLLAHGWQAFARRIRHDLELARWLHHLASAHPELEPMLEPDLSIVCLRYLPEDLHDDEEAGPYLDDLNEQVMFALQRGGRLFPSSAVVAGRFAIRACLISYRTEADDVEALVSEIARLGRELDAKLRARERPARTHPGATRGA